VSIRPVETETAIVSWTTGVTQARLVRMTPSVLLLEGTPPDERPEIGTPVQVSIPGMSRMRPARLAAFAPDGRILLALGKRPVRGAVRIQTDLPAELVAGQAKWCARVVDLSSSGARIRGAQLTVGAECELNFLPPGRRVRVTMRCVVVRAIEANEAAVAFCSGALSFRIELV
jgi:PilZ domain